MAETPDSTAAQCPFPETPEAAERWANRTMMGGRVEIDTSPPFGSVKEAVSHFEGRALWNWISLHMLRQQGRDACKVYGISTMGEQAAELEKELTEKEQETLHVLRELGRAKKMVEELKFKLGKQVSADCMSTPDLMPNVDHISRPSAVQTNITSPEIVAPCGYREGGCSTPFNCGSTPPKLIIAELKQTRMNLSRTTDELAFIRASVESLNEQMLREKISMRDTHEKFASDSVGFASPLRVELGARSPTPKMALHEAETRGGFLNFANISMELQQLNFAAEQFIRMAEAAKCEVLRAMSEIEQTKAGLKTAEMRWFAAKKMDEAARAVEAVAIAESKDLSNNGRNSSAAVPNRRHDDGITLTLEEYSLLAHKARKAEELSKKILMGRRDEANNNSSKLNMLKKLGQATQEDELSRGALEEALNRVDVANLNTEAVLNAKENLQRCWEQESSQMTLPNRIPNPTRLKNYVNIPENSYVNPSKVLNHDSKPVLRPSIALRDMVGQKQISPVDVGVRSNRRDPVDGQAVPLSEMLRLQRNVMLAVPGSDGRNGIDDQKHFFAQRKRFGFIHLSLPLTKQGRKKRDALNSNPASHGE